MMFGWGDHGWGAGAWIIMALAMAVLWTLLVIAVVAVVRHFGHAHEPAASTMSGPEAILRERLARGDIDEQEFRKRLATLRERV